MPLTHLTRTIALLAFVLSTNLLGAQIFASLDPIPVDEEVTSIEKDVNEAWLSIPEAVLYASKSDQSTNLVYTLAETERITIDLSDSQGRVIKKYTRNAKRSAGDYEQKIILPYGLPTGTYFLNITSGSGRVSVKVKHG